MNDQCIIFFIYILIICILYCSILLFLIGYRQYKPHAFNKLSNYLS